MAHWKKFLLATTVIVAISGPLYANQEQDERTRPAGESTQAGMLPDHLLGAPPEIMSEPPAGPEAAPAAAKSCASAGNIVHNVSSTISFFYPFPAKGFVKDGDAVRMPVEGGVMLIDGAQYTLRSIEFPHHPALPFSAVQYPMEARFVHDAADGSKAILSVPVAEGQANLGIEMMLQNSGSGSLDPNDLLPADRTFAMVENIGCGEAAVRRYVLTTPVQVSAAQLQKFEQLF